MPCLNQFPSPVFPDPDLVNIIPGTPDDNFINLDPAARLLVPAELSDGFSFEDKTTDFSASSEIAREACASKNKTLSEIEAQCAKDFIEKCERSLEGCRSAANKFLDKVVFPIYDKCSQGGESVRETRRALHQGSAAPKNWWIGPTPQ